MLGAPRSRDDLAHVHQWRVEARELQTYLHHCERKYEERLNEMEHKCEREAKLRESASLDTILQEKRSEATLVGARVEIERLTQAVASAEERTRKSESSVAGLLAESQEAAKLMSLVTSKFDHQVNISKSLTTKLKESEAEAASLRKDLEDALVREAQKTRLHDVAEASIANLQATFSETFVPRLQEEAKVEARAAQDASESRQLLKQAQRDFAFKDECYQAELRQYREEKAALGRKCSETQQMAALHANAGYQWQQRSRAAEEELVRSGLTQHHLWDAALRTRDEQKRQQEQLQRVEEERDRALHGKMVAEQSGRELRGWVVSSLEEVNRSAHVGGDPYAPDNAKSFQGRAWVDMLESFRKDQQTRTGAGCRTRQPI